MKTKILGLSTISLLTLTASSVVAFQNNNLDDVKDSVILTPSGQKLNKSNSEKDLFYGYNEAEKEFYPVKNVQGNVLTVEERQKLNGQLENQERMIATKLAGINSLEQSGAELDKNIKKQLNTMAADKELLDVMEDDNCLLNRLNSDEVQKYGVLSAAVYHKLYEKRVSVKRSSAANKTERLAADLQKSIDSLRELKEAVRGVFNTNDIEKEGHKLSRRQNNLVKTLKAHDIQLENGVDLDIRGQEITSINRVIGKIDTQLESKYNELRLTKQTLSGQNSDHFEAVKQALNLNTFARGYEVQHILYRNNGELSGIVLFNKETAELSFVMAGSKSTMDWVRNFCGWNSNTSLHHGNLAGLHVHAGFAASFEDTMNSFNAFLPSFLEDWKKENPNKKLSIVGTGHSLGGALATLFTLTAIDMAQKQGIELNKKGTVTFGEPNVFNAADLERVVEKAGGKGNFLRIQDKLDPVPHAAFWRSSPGVTIRANAGFFTNQAGVMQLPVRFNPHSTDHYGHFADLVFTRYKEKMNSLKAITDQKKTNTAHLVEAKASHQKSVKELRSAVNALLNDQNRQEYRENKVEELNNLVKGDLRKNVAQAAKTLKQAPASDLAAEKKKLAEAKKRLELAKAELLTLENEQKAFEADQIEFRRKQEEERAKMLTSSFLGSITLDESNLDEFESCLNEDSSDSDFEDSE